MFINDSFISDRNEAAFARLAKADRRWKWPDLMEIHRTRPDTVTRNQKFDQRTVEAAHDFIDDFFIDPTYDRATPDRPLLLKVSLIQPHYPYITTPDRLRYYFNRVTPFLDEPLFDHPFLSERAVRVPEDATPREIRRATAAYYGMIDHIDTHYGSVLDALREVGQDLDDWVIVYTSDHGEMLGQHGVWEKQKFFEASVRVPLVIRWPKRFAPRIVTENVNLCDLFATLCELGGIDAPGDLESRSLVPLMEGRSGGWDNETVSQFGGRNLMIKRDALKYHYYGEDMPEVLFEHEADPDERVNCISAPRHADALAAFRRRRAELMFGPVQA
ncbi:MAG: sulfatase-like hydrolase/transferase [Verrucomicrobiota bacterium]